MASSSRVARVTVLLAGVALLVSSLAATGGGDDRAGAGPAIAPAGSSAAIITAPSTAPELSPSVARRWARLRTVSKASRPPPGVAGGADVPTMATVPISWSGSAPAVAVPTALQRSDRAAPDRVEPVSEPPGPVVAQRPRLRVDVAARDAHEMAARIRPLPGVSAAAGVLRGIVQVTGVDGPTAVSMAAVEPETFRPLTPQATAESTAVWERLLDGDAAFTHDAATRLALTLGASVPAGDDAELLRVGAFASNGVPPVADVIVSRRTAARLDVGGVGSVLIATAAGVEPEALAETIAAATGLQPTVLAEPQARRAFLTGSETRDAFEPFTYIDNGDGLIQIDPGWVQRNVVSAEVPILRGAVRCHRLLIAQLRGALAELQSLGLSSLIDASQYGGCHVGRHIDFDPFLPLSMHAWGLAVDLNVATNGLGRTPQMDPRVVEVFERWGFSWGGRWSRPDGMHFELGALLESPQG